MGTNTGELDIYFTNHLGQVIQNRVIENYLPSGYLTNTWQEVSIPLSDLGISSYNNTLALNIESATTQTVYLDEIRFIGTTTSSSFTQSNRYTGHDYDEETSLTYMGARYYDGNTGRFTAQDPVSLLLGDANSLEAKGIRQHFLLRDPQQLNSYSYSRNNPIVFVDNNGENPVPILVSIALAVFGSLALDDANYAYTPDETFDSALAPQSTNPVGYYVFGQENYDSLSENQKIVFSIVIGSLDGKPDIRHLIPENRLSHIFRDEVGHLADTPQNRQLLQNVADDPSTTLGSDKWGNTWSARLNKNGSQTWVQTRDGQIINGGQNVTPRTFNSETGLSAPEPVHQRRLPRSDQDQD